MIKFGIIIVMLEIKKIGLLYLFICLLINTSCGQIGNSQSFICQDKFTDSCSFGLEYRYDTEYNIKSSIYGVIGNVKKIVTKTTSNREGQIFYTTSVSIFNSQGYILYEKTKSDTCITGMTYYKYNDKNELIKKIDYGIYCDTSEPRSTASYKRERNRVIRSYSAFNINEGKVLKSYIAYNQRGYRAKTSMDEKGIVISYSSYDSEGRLLSDSISGAWNYVKKYLYDDNNNQIGYFNPANKDTTLNNELRFDKFGNKVRPNAKYTYDSANNWITETYKKGNEEIICVREIEYF